jgi:predicted Fe-S protein YdhL (DUF1289 family)
MDETETYCIGCMRTEQEIMEWMSYSEEQQLQIMEDLKTRKFDVDVVFDRESNIYYTKE